ncbi:MAG: PqqD family peptide modification chaperone [bacterium]|nr:PqqD family peptide modification chaperone [bacterium]
MSTSFFSPSWYRVADLKPRLRSHAQIHRQRFRGQVWYILQDHQTGHFHRVSPAAHLMINLLNGQRSVDEVWQIVGKQLGDDQPTQDETIQLLTQLHQADLLRGELPPDLDELARRSDKQKRRKLLTRMRNPLALRFPLIDPERFLRATAPLVAPVFSVTGFIAWLALVGWGLALAVTHWSGLTGNIADRVLAGENILLMLLVYPLIKAVHEFGHAYAAKRWGGEVHEMGIMFLVLMPVPYVDASTSAAFRSRWQRAVVGAAGIMTEMAIAALAMLLWVNLEEGVARSMAFNAMLIAGVSTLFFNGNPLLRFDGYWVLCDLVEIPNLGSRANRYIFYLIQRYLLGISDAQSPASAPGEPGWFVGYGLAAFAYRLFIMYGISLFLATNFLALGVLLALWAIAVMFLLPLGKGVKFLATSPKLHNRRKRAFATVFGASALLITPFALIPVPYATIAEGVVWLPERASVRAATEGTIKTLLATPNTEVDAGAPLIALEDPILAAQITILETEHRELKLRLDQLKLVDRVQADMIKEQIRHIDASLALARQRMESLTVRTPEAGRFVISMPEDLPGRFVQRGTLLGYVIGDHDPVVRVVVDQDDVDLIRSRTRSVQVRFVEALASVAAATIEREVPAASQELPGSALSTAGGGTQQLDPTAPENLRVLESIFEFDLRVSSALPDNAIGGRAYARFDHGSEPLVWQTLRALRQLFLSLFNV